MRTTLKRKTLVEKQKKKWIKEKEMKKKQTNLKLMKTTVKKNMISYINK